MAAKSPMKPRRAWSAAEDAILRDCYERNLPLDNAEKALGRSYYSISNRARFLGLRLDTLIVRRRFNETLQTALTNPAVKARQTEGKRKSWTPERRAKNAEFTRQRQLHLVGMAAIRANPAKYERSKPLRVAGVKAYFRALLSWCPDYLLPSYYVLREKVGRDEARVVISDDWQRDLRRALKAIAAVAKPLAEEQRRQYRSFEAELERAKTRGIREVVPMVRADYGFSLTGGSLA